MQILPNRREEEEGEEEERESKRRAWQLEDVRRARRKRKGADDRGCWEEEQDWQG